MDESGGIEPLGLITTTPVFGTGCRPFGSTLEAIVETEGIEPSFQRCERRVLPLDDVPSLGGRNRTCVDLVPSQVVSL